MKSFAWILVLSILIAPFGVAQEAGPAPDQDLSFDKIQEMLDRFGDTTMRSIEEQLERKLDAYEKSVNEAQQEHAVEGPSAGATYRLVFRLSDISAPMSVMSSAGDYSLVAQHAEDETSGSNSITREYTLNCKGELRPGGSQDMALVTFTGQAMLSTTENQADTRSQRNGSIAFTGSGEFRLGTEQEIVRNDDLAVMLTVEPLVSAIPAEAGAR